MHQTRQAQISKETKTISYPAGNLFIPAPHGRLEAIIKHPTAQAARGAALVLHPHPLGGGTMHNKVAFRAARALLNARYTTLRINFRGVGLSTGSHDEGRGEQADARVALDYLNENYPQLSVTLAGFSFGSYVGAHVAIEDERVKRFIAIGTPINKYNFDFLHAITKPSFFLHGEQDEFGDVEKLRQLVATLPREAQAQLVVIKDAGHFFDTRLDEYEQAISDWAQAG